MSKGARWFVDRMPSPDVVDRLLTGDSVEQLVAISRDRAIANIALDLHPKLNQDAALVEASLKVALAAAARIAKEGDQAQLSDQEEAALELFVLLVSRPSLFVRGGRVCRLARATGGASGAANFGVGPRAIGIRLVRCPVDRRRVGLAPSRHGP